VSRGGTETDVRRGLRGRCENPSGLFSFVWDPQLALRTVQGAGGEDVHRNAFATRTRKVFPDDNGDPPLPSPNGAAKRELLVLLCGRFEVDLVQLLPLEGHEYSRVVRVTRLAEQGTGH
jgi:hypothetical protein